MSSQRPSIKIPDFQTEVRTFFKEFEKRFSNLQSSFNNYNTLVVGILAIGFIILLFSLVTVLIQSWQITSTFRDENNQLKIQSEVINNDVEQQKTTNQRLDKIEEKLNDLHPVLAK